MRKIERIIYQHSELSDKAKEKAHYSWCSNTDYPWGSENDASIVGFADVLGFVGFRNIENIQHFLSVLICRSPRVLRGKGKRFVESLVEKDCPFSGYWLDSVIVDTLKKHLNIHPFDLKAAVIDALEGAERAIQQDIDNYYSEEFFAGECSVNEWEFFADGTQYHGAQNLRNFPSRAVFTNNARY